MKLFNCFIVMAMTVMSSALYARPVLKPMADVVILPDDSVVLADPFIDAATTQDGGGPLLQLLNPRIYQTIALYKKVSLTAPFTSNDIDKMYDRLLNKRTDLRFFGLPSAEEMNKYCFAGRPVYTIPSGASVQQAACTKGNDTFIVKPLFLKLSIRDQAMLLIHERLTTIADDRGWINFVAVAKYTTGLNTFLNIYDEQAKRVYRELTVKEQTNLTNFYGSILEINNRNAEYGNMPTLNWSVQQNGGGIVHLNAVADPSAFISLNSVIKEKSEVAANAKVINLTFDGDNSASKAVVLKVGENTVLENVNFVFNSSAPNRLITIGANSRFSNVVFTSAASYYVSDASSFFGANTIVKDSTFLTLGINSGDNVSITDSKIAAKQFNLGDGVVFQRAEFAYVNSNVKVAANEKLINQSANELYADQYYPANVIPKPFFQTIKVPLFKCISNVKAEKKGWEWNESYYDSEGDGLSMKGWIAYNGRNGLKKEYEYNYSDTVIVISVKKFARATTPVVFLDEKGVFVLGDYVRKSRYINVNLSECVAAGVMPALNSAGISLTNSGLKIPFQN